MSEKQERAFRHKFWINPDVQRRFVVFFILACAVVSAGTVFLIFECVWGSLYPFLSIPGDKEAFFRGVLMHAITATAILFVISAVGGGLLMIFVTHRIAGPVYRIRKILDATEVPETNRLRPGDALQDVYAKVYALHSKHFELAERYNKLITTVGELCEQLDREDRPSEAADTLADLKKLVAQAAEEKTGELKTEN